ncbi:MAG: hypothetical protein K2X66_12150 [Cyanobacteria bacterium]|nr:hypothetical protein [Cyanobacteriota bacterium]
MSDPKSDYSVFPVNGKILSNVGLADLQLRQKLLLEGKLAAPPKAPEIPISPVKTNPDPGQSIKTPSSKGRHRFPVVVSKDSPVSKGFEARMRDAVDHIPLRYLEVLQKGGYNLLLCKHSLEAFPKFRSQKPRGYEHGSTFALTRGFCTEFEIVIAEFYQDGSGESHRTHDGEYVLRHEMGHAIDWCWRGSYNPKAAFSMRADFFKAYQEDLKFLTPEDYQKLSYFLQGSDPKYCLSAGRSEAFAENIALLLGGTSLPNEYIQAKFANVHQLLKQVFAV